MWAWITEGGFQKCFLACRVTNTTVCFHSGTACSHDDYRNPGCTDFSAFLNLFMYFPLIIWNLQIHYILPSFWIFWFGFAVLSINSIIYYISPGTHDRYLSFNIFFIFAILHAFLFQGLTKLIIPLKPFFTFCHVRTTNFCVFHTIFL